MINVKKFVIAEKAGMSQLFKEDGVVIPVTLLEVKENVVSQIKTQDSDGYESVQIAFGKTKDKSLTKAETGHLKNVGAFKGLREFRPENISEYKKGDSISADKFEVGDSVIIRGRTVGKGFQGVVKRHGFAGGPASHGHRHALRQAGSIGSAYPQKVFKGKKMAGRMGGGNLSVKNLKIVKIDKDKNLIFVRGAVPGKKGAIVEVIGIE